jgi:hypothetical protein
MKAVQERLNQEKNYKLRIYELELNLQKLNRKMNFKISNTQEARCWKSSSSKKKYFIPKRNNWWLSFTQYSFIINHLSFGNKLLFSNLFIFLFENRPSVNRKLSCFPLIIYHSNVNQYFISEEKETRFWWN